MTARRPFRYGRLVLAVALLAALNVAAVLLLRQALVVGADRALLRGELERALEGYDRALAIYPSSPRVHEKKGDLLFRDGQWEPALREIVLALRAQPGDAVLEAKKKRLEAVIESKIYDMAPMRFYDEYSRRLQKKRGSTFLVPRPGEVPTTQAWRTRRQDSLQFQISILYNYFLGTFKGSGWVFSGKRYAPSQVTISTERCLRGHFIAVLGRHTVKPCGLFPRGWTLPELWMVGYDVLTGRARTYLFTGEDGRPAQSLERVEIPLLNPDQLVGSGPDGTEMRTFFVPAVNTVAFNRELMKPWGALERSHTADITRDWSSPPVRLPDDLFDAGGEGADPAAFPRSFAGRWKGSAQRAGRQYGLTARGGLALEGKLLLLAVEIGRGQKDDVLQVPYQEYLLFGLDAPQARNRVWCFTSEGTVNALAAGKAWDGGGQRFEEELGGARYARTFTVAKDGALEMTVSAAKRGEQERELFRARFEKSR